MQARDPDSNSPSSQQGAPDRAPGLCRDCLAYSSQGRARPGRCPACHSPRQIAHSELFSLSIAHLDCDAFYASVEKHDDPSLANRPVIVGGGTRGVVATACYVARISGVRSAMPMFQALRLCPDAVVLAPRIARYAEVSRAIRARMLQLTPLVEPLSLDEAFLDLTGTERLHGAPPALSLARLARDIEADLGITLSIGLSHNKFLAKIASDLDKPRGFSVIGRAQTAAFLHDRPVRMIWGVGLAMQTALESAGIRRFGDLLRWDRRDLAARFGAAGERLYHLARGEDHRRVTPDAPVKSISKEVTLDADSADPDLLRAHLWRLAQQVSDRAKARDLAGRVVALKMKRADFTLITRRHQLREPSQLADRIWAEAQALFAAAGDQGPLRLIGLGISDLVPAASGDLTGDLLDPAAQRRAAVERASDKIRARFGADAIGLGRGRR